MFYCEDAARQEMRFLACVPLTAPRKASLRRVHAICGLLWSCNDGKYGPQSFAPCTAAKFLPFVLYYLGSMPLKAPGSSLGNQTGYRGAEGPIIAHSTITTHFTPHPPPALSLRTGRSKAMSTMGTGQKTPSVRAVVSVGLVQFKISLLIRRFLPGRGIQQAREKVFY